VTSPAGLQPKVLFTALSDFEIAIPKGMTLPGIPSQDLAHLDQISRADEMSIKAMESAASLRAQTRK
jgi:hypothetical protein